MMLMPLNSRGCSELQQQREQHLAKATRLLLQEDDVDGAAEVLEKIRIGDELLKYSNVSRCRRFCTFALILIIPVFVTILLLLSKVNPGVRLDVKTKAAILTPVEKREWKWKLYPAPAAENILIEGALGIEAPGLGLSKKADYLVADGKSIILKDIEARGCSRLQVERNDGFTDFYLYDSDIQGSFTLQESELRVSVDNQIESRSISGQYPILINFKAATKGKVPLRLRLKTKKDFDLEELQISTLTLQREELPGSGSFISAIVSGTVELQEFQQEEKLEERDSLHLQEASSTRLRLSFAGADKDSFNLSFRGRVRSLSAGPKGLEKDLTPSWLLWLSHNKELATFWSAFPVVLTLLSGLHSLMEKK